MNGKGMRFKRVWEEQAISSVDLNCGSVSCPSSVVDWKATESKGYCSSSSSSTGGSIRISNQRLIDLLPRQLLMTLMMMTKVLTVAGQD